jgi:hypothetical protein
MRDGYACMKSLYAVSARGAAAAAPEGGALTCPSILTPTSSWWALVTPSRVMPGTVGS